MNLVNVISKNLDALEDDLDDVRGLAKTLNEQFTEFRDSMVILTEEEFNELIHDSKQSEKDYKVMAQEYQKELDELDKKMKERLKKILSVL